MKHLFLFVVLNIMLAACSVEKNGTPFADFSNSSGLALAHIDTDIRPQDDLYRHVNGKWIENTEIPEHMALIGNLIDLRNTRDLRVYDILAEFIRRENKQPGSNEQILGDFFYSLLQDQLVAGKGVEPIRALLTQVEQITSLKQLEQTLARFSFSNIKIPIGFDVRPNLEDPSQHILNLFQGDLGLPDRDYYVNPELNFLSIRQAYKAYLTEILALANFDMAGKRAQNAYHIEALLAEAQWGNADRRDPLRITNHYLTEDLSGLTDKLDWDVYLDTLGAASEEVVNIRESGYFKALGSILEEQPLEAWKDYLRVLILEAYAPYLEEKFRITYYDFHAGIIGGIGTTPSRLQDAITLINDVLGNAIGKAYVERYFTQQTRQRVGKIVTGVKGAFRERLQNNTWMSEATKLNALNKLENILTEIGHPKSWTDYSGLSISQFAPVQNIQNLYAFYYRQRVEKLGTPVSRTAWKLAPSAVNAQFLPYQNTMFYPAGFLEPPYFNPSADDAVNYAGIGMIVGHELGHAFDDQGRHFGPTGALENWWTDDDLANFKARTQSLVDLFQDMSPIAGLAIDGKVTLGENISDLVGVQIAYDAYVKSLNGREAPVINGLTGPQRFFMGYAQSRRSKARPEFLRHLLVSDPHVPDEYRVLGILPHIPSFYDAFGVKEGDGMYLPPEKRVTIW